MTATYRRLDNQYGGGHARDTVARYLHQEVTPLLTDGRYDHPTGQRLLSAAAELAQLAGWQAYDTAEHGIASGTSPSPWTSPTPPETTASARRSSRR